MRDNSDLSLELKALGGSQAALLRREARGSGGDGPSDSGSPPASPTGSAYDLPQQQPRVWTLFRWLGARVTTVKAVGGEASGPSAARRALLLGGGGGPRGIGSPTMGSGGSGEITDDLHAGQYRRALSAFDLTLIGIGGIIGAGISKENAGPALVLSFLLAGIVSSFSSLCYAEMASLVPTAGSAYTYAYATLGELVAWIVGWDLILEYLVGGATVAAGWSEYLVNFVHTTAGATIDPRWTSSTFTWVEVGSTNASGLPAGFHRNMVACADGPCAAYANFIAIALCLTIMGILLIGVKLSTTVNNVFVAVKVVVVLLFIFVG
ncbi:Cationic amino acid transporter-1, partial [Cladochytrium tenue]